MEKGGEGGKREEGEGRRGEGWGGAGNEDSEFNLYEFLLLLKRQNKLASFPGPTQFESLHGNEANFRVHV